VIDLKGQTMTIELKAPTLPESVPDGTIATWYKNVGDTVTRDELLVDIETDKVVIEVVSPTDGVLKEIIKNTGDTIVSNEAIGSVTAGEASASPAAPMQVQAAEPSSASTDESLPSPAAKKLISENELDGKSIAGSGKDGRITKEDVVSHMQKPTPSASASPVTAVVSADGRTEERVPMSRLRAKVAERLLHATQSTAMLTTFNEVNMKPIMDIRSRYKDQFE
jgi:2-oxoglutarate dehydrogenase E2 component (dihydrolipoamide succinyltransferase)